MPAIISLIVGILLDLYFDPTVPSWLQPFLPVAIVTGLDALFGAARAWPEGAFHNRISITSFFWNVTVACLLVLMGNQLGVGSAVTTTIVVILGVRIFSNIASVRRLILRT